MGTIRIIWLILGLSFMASFVLPVGEGNIGYSYFIWAWCSLLFPPSWLLSASLLANFWFVWAWVAVGISADYPTRRSHWKGIIIAGVIANILAFTPILMSVFETPPKVENIGVVVWMGSILGMLLLTLKISASRSDRN